MCNLSLEYFASEVLDDTYVCLSSLEAKVGIEVATGEDMISQTLREGLWEEGEGKVEEGEGKVEEGGEGKGEGEGEEESEEGGESTWWTPPRLDLEEVSMHTARRVDPVESRAMKIAQERKSLEREEGGDKRRDERASVLAQRHLLPIYQHRQEILNSLEEHPMLVLSGDTGSGKGLQ